jgi:hypothetical protein
MNELRATNWLLLCIGLMVFNKFYPNTAKEYSYVVLGIGAIWVVYTLIKTWRRDEAERKQERKEQDKNSEFIAELNVIRAKYDPRHEWNEATSLPEAYEREVETLRRKHGIY